MAGRRRALRVGWLRVLSCEGGRGVVNAIF
jgi:hypothetical protein